MEAVVFVVPWLKNLLGVTSIGLADALVAAAGGVLPLFINEGAKKVLFQQPSSGYPARRRPP